jgi:hypothetical protein
MTRAKSEVLEGGYIVVDRTRLRAKESTDPTKWALWKLIWECSSFEQLAALAPPFVETTSTGRRITWKTGGALGPQEGMDSQDRQRWAAVIIGEPFANLTRYHAVAKRHA